MTFNYTPLFRELSDEGHGQWSAVLQAECRKQISTEAHGNLEVWQRILDQLPLVSSCTRNECHGTVTVQGDASPDVVQSMRSLLMEVRPWRKGPFDLFGIAIDTEWRSNLKWDRLKGHVELRDRNVLDIGCGNGYYGWRMLSAGARRVVGLDPFLLYVAQHEAIRRYAGPSAPNYVLPVSDEVIPERLNAFDVTFSMGVLYHRSSPIDHLQKLRASLRPGGQVVLETLVIESSESTVLVPQGRYAKMRNVWFIPSVSMLQTWLSRTGFRDIVVVDVSRTSTAEQRRTEWMTYESLADFLNPEDDRQTIEGYPGPVRAVLTAIAS